MKPLPLLALLLTGVAHAQLLPAATEPAAAASAAVVLRPWSLDELTAERARIGRERSAATERFAAAEQDCWQRFAVNACLRTARQQQRQVLDLLRQQEVVLDGIERRQRARAKLDEIERRQQGPSD